MWYFRPNMMNRLQIEILEFFKISFASWENRRLQIFQLVYFELGVFGIWIVRRYNNKLCIQKHVRIEQWVVNVLGSELHAEGDMVLGIAMLRQGELQLFWLVGSHVEAV